MTKNPLPPPKVAVFQGAFSDQVQGMFRNRGWEVTYVPEAADLIVLTGGVDINPKLYGEPRIKEGQIPSDERDEAEINIYNTFINKPKVGICRGAQLMNVLNGGGMYQHVTGHHQSHQVRDTFGNETKFLKVTSMHHQMMQPGPDAEVFCYAKEATTLKSGNEDIGTITLDTPSWDDVEGVWYPKTKTLCYQPHPEIDLFEGRDYFFNLLSRYFNMSYRRYPSAVM